jgi:hypothetical protein
MYCWGKHRLGSMPSSDNRCRGLLGVRHAVAFQEEFNKLLLISGTDLTDLKGIPSKIKSNSTIRPGGPMAQTSPERACVGPRLLECGAKERTDAHQEITPIKSGPHCRSRTTTHCFS